MSDDSGCAAQASLKVVALQACELPLSWYHSAIQVQWTPGLKKLLAFTTVSAVSLVFLAQYLKRRRGKKKKKVSEWEPEPLLLESAKNAAWEKGSSCSSSRQNLTLSLSSFKEKGSQSLHVNGGLLSKHSDSMQSLASVHSVNSGHSCLCPKTNCWDKADEDEMKLVNIPVTTPENLYLMGMELFEEALRRWEQALTFRNRQAEDEASCSSIKMGAGDAIAEESVEDIISADFIHKLESLLQRAYRLQEEFEATLGASDPASLANDIGDAGYPLKTWLMTPSRNPAGPADERYNHAQSQTRNPIERALGVLKMRFQCLHNTGDKDTDITVKETTDDFFLRDTLSIASTDSFVSAAELAEHREMRSASSLDSLCRCPLYEDAMRLAEEGKVYCRVLRTEMLECLGDSDFLAKLHCIRQAFQLILSESKNRLFLLETARKVLSTLIVKARKNPKKFEDVFDEMVYFLEQINHWETTEMELIARGVKKLNFYDIVLDFIIMDSFEDLDNPPTSIQNVVNNRWLNSSFKETAVASSCWAVLKQKRQQMKMADGFFAHFYAICEQISPVLAWGFLGPRNSFHDVCCFFKDQVLYFLKDIFDFEKVRYSNHECLAEDIMQLLHRRTELVMAYLGVASQKNGIGCGSGPAMSSGFVETKVQLLK